MVTLTDLIEKLLQENPDTVIELLDLTTEELVMNNLDIVEHKFTYLVSELFNGQFEQMNLFEDIDD